MHTAHRKHFLKKLGVLAKMLMLIPPFVLSIIVLHQTIVLFSLKITSGALTTFGMQLTIPWVVLLMCAAFACTMMPLLASVNLMDELDTVSPMAKPKDDFLPF